MKKFWFFALEGVADELQHPSQDEEDCGVAPEPMEENAGQEDDERKQNGGNSERMACPVDGILVASGILRDPLLAGPST